MLLHIRLLALLGRLSSCRHNQNFPAADTVITFCSERLQISPRGAAPEGIQRRTDRYVPSLTSMVFVEQSELGAIV